MTQTGKVIFAKYAQVTNNPAPWMPVMNGAITSGLKFTANWENVKVGCLRATHENDQIFPFK